ncbi:hypothetical protein HY411_00795, partial [Candidatus Gottesmanbacteria bacterium]|nr:hypothetical protein [Candidatus Gottesmanbacteria bacterium]
MRVDGKAIAEQILTDLVREVVKLKKKGVTPTLAVIQVGDDPGSTAYIRQKQKAAEKIGASLILSHQPACRQGRSSAVSCQQIQSIVEKYNTDPAIHGLILQRPLPEPLAAETLALCSTIQLSKDVDGFLPNSPYPVPVASAVLEILQVTFSLITYRLS